MFLIYPFLAFASLLFAGLTMVLAPALVLFADASGNLPGRLALFQTFDATLDAGWRDGYFGSWQAEGAVPTCWRLWWLRTRWLWRNPGYTFDYTVLGCAFDSSEWHVIRCEVPANGPVSFFTIGPSGRFNWMGKIGRFQVKLGWKAWNMWDSTASKWKAEPWGPELRIPLCASAQF